MTILGRIFAAIIVACMSTVAIVGTYAAVKALL